MTNTHPPSGGHPHWFDEVADLVIDLAVIGHLPYDPTPEALYTPADLYRGFEAGGFAGTMDQAAYARARRAGSPPTGPREALAQRLHDHGITVALDRFRAGRDLVGVMGGHALARGSEGYRQGVALGRHVAKAGFCVVTGGGPGAMEAANLGAATADLAEETVDSLVSRLSTVPEFADDADGFVGIALEVAAEVRRLANPVDTLSVPTWFYGHEPTNPFATHVAKYFSNSEREDGLLAIALSGIVFLAGGPGTVQEVFQDAAQNAYRTFGEPAPMVFLNPPDKADHWEASGVMRALDSTFTDHSGGRRPGWDRLANVASVPAAVAALVSSAAEGPRS